MPTDIKAQVAIVAGNASGIEKKNPHIFLPGTVYMRGSRIVLHVTKRNNQILSTGILIG